METANSLISALIFFLEYIELSSQFYYSLDAAAEPSHRRRNNMEPEIPRLRPNFDLHHPLPQAEIFHRHRNILEPEIPRIRENHNLNRIPPQAEHHHRNRDNIEDDYDFLEPLPGVPSLIHTSNRHTGPQNGNNTPDLRRVVQDPARNPRHSASPSRIDPRTYKPSPFPVGLTISPHVNPHRIFELKTYKFPADRRIQTKSSDSVMEKLPNKTKIVVVATTSGEAFATFDLNRHLRPIYEYDSDDVRMKINIITGLVSRMSSQEIMECPIDCLIGEDHFVIIKPTFSRENQH